MTHECHTGVTADIPVCSTLPKDDVLGNMKAFEDVREGGKAAWGRYYDVCSVGDWIMLKVFKTCQVVWEGKILLL